MLGAGSSGEHFVGALRRLEPDIRITVVERELAGGECSYYACIPTKTLLRPTEVLASARLAPGAAEAITGEIDVERVLWWRDQVTEGRDDSWHVGWLEKQNAELVRGEARVRRAGRRRPSASGRSSTTSSWSRPARRRRCPRSLGWRTSSTGRTATRSGQARCRGASSFSAAARSGPSSRSSSGVWGRRSRWSSTTRTSSPGSTPMRATCWPRVSKRTGSRSCSGRKPSTSSVPRAGSA